MLFIRFRISYLWNLIMSSTFVNIPNYQVELEISIIITITLADFKFFYVLNQKYLFFFFFNNGDAKKLLIRWD